MMTRRQFIPAAAGLAACAVLVPHAPARARRLGFAGDEGYFEVAQSGPSARVLFGEGGNSLVVLGEGESMLVDCKNAPFGTTLRRQAAAGAPPLKWVVNTHHHADHTGGNHAFRDVTLIAHEKAAPRIAENIERFVGGLRGGPAAVARSTRPGKDEAMAQAQALAERAGEMSAADFAPTRTVGDLHEFTVGGLKVVLRHFGAGHTDNDAVVHVPGLNLIHAGDLLFHRVHPFIDPAAGSTTAGWQKSLDGIIALCDDKTVVVPGHGATGALTDVNGLREQRDYFDKLRRIVDHARNNDGMTRDETVRIQTGAFEGYGGQERLARAIGAVYDELSQDK